MKEWTTRQEEIMDLALLLIAEKGIQGLTIRNLAKRVGFSEPAVYRHFESKTHILLGVLERFSQASQEAHLLIVADTAPPMKRLEAFLLGSLRRFQERPQIAAVIFAEEIFQNEPLLAEKVEKIMRLHHESLRNLVQEAQVSGQLREDLPVDGIVLLVQGGIRLLVSRWRMGGHDSDLLVEGRAFIALLRILLIRDK
jgi:TetR/AcrR family transcriptional regulator, fatty acid metabolism regulator protein